MTTDPKLACFYHPIKVIFLDDNRAFLDALDLEFSSKFNILTLTNSDQAFHLLNNSTYTTESIFHLMNDIDQDTSNDRLIGFDLSKMLNLIYNKKRFDHAPLLVVDYQMPSINGIDFCKKLKENKIFKLMLTAEADKDTAIHAFNDGLIDKFILKTSENLYSQITSAIQDLTHRYFKELTKNIVNTFNNMLHDLFSNELYQQLFNQIRIQTQAVEYYLVDNSGSILFLDKDANPTWLIIRHIKDLIDQLDLLQGYELPTQTMNAVRNKEKILFLLSEKEYKKPISEWDSYLFDAKMLDHNYYYSITQSHITDSIDWERVVPYSSYISDL